MRDLKLLDSETGKTYVIQVSDQHFIEVVHKNNLALATTLLQERLNYIAAFNLIHENQGDSNSCVNGLLDQDNQVSNPELRSHSTDKGGSQIIIEDVQEKGPEKNEDSTLEINKMWTSDATKYLISLCKKYDKEFEKGVKKYVWNKVAAQLTEKFHVEYSAQQCDTKYKVLKNMYKQVKKHNEQSGNNMKKWEFYDLMDELLFSKPEIKAKAIGSSSRGIVLKENQMPNENSPKTPKHFDNQNTSEEEEECTTPKFRSSFMKKKTLLKGDIGKKWPGRIAI